MITGLQYAEMIISAANNLSNNKELLNEMNVFPVPDGDTGKNMSMSISGAKAAAEDAISRKYDAGTTAEKVAMATLRGARGNSGVILSQLLRGIAKELKGKKEATPALLVKCFASASATAYSAVMKPTEGTILTVARESSEELSKMDIAGKDCVDVMSELVRAANVSLDHTPELLPKLKQAGVVDAGGKGWVLALEGMLYYLKNGKAVSTEESAVESSGEKLGEIADEEITFTYCTEFLIDKSSPEANVEGFKKTIAKIGDCMVVIEDFDIVKVHIHTDNPGIVIQNALKIGSLNDIKIDNMRYQHNEKIGNFTEEAPEPKKEEIPIPVEKAKYAVISVSAGEGYSEIMKELGCAEIIEGGQTMNPSAGDILEAVVRANAETVYVLPNNKNIIMAAEAARDMADVNVVVIPTTSVPQGIAALISYDADGDSAVNSENMTMASNAVTTGSVTYAVRDSSNNGVEIKKDDIIGLGIGGVVASSKDINEVALEVCKNIVTDETSIVTLYYGEDIKEEYAQALAEMVEEAFEDVDVSVQRGGQPIYYYNIAAE